MFTFLIILMLSLSLLFINIHYRWLDVDEDDGKIIRDLTPAGETGWQFGTCFWNCTLEVVCGDWKIIVQMFKDSSIKSLI